MYIHPLWLFVVFHAVKKVNDDNSLRMMLYFSIIHTVITNKHTKHFVFADQIIFIALCNTAGGKIAIKKN